MRNICISFFILFILLPRHAAAQEITADTTAVVSKKEVKNSAKENKNDSTSIASKKRANHMALMSAVVPGLGQVFNKKYWKVPIIYGAGGALIYFINSNNTEYLKYKDALIIRNDQDSTTIDDYPRYTNEDLTVRKNYYRRNRDFCYILTGLLYTLNIIDAYVDSQLMNFDVSDDLSLHSTPALNYSAEGTPILSMNLVFTFK